MPEGDSIERVRQAITPLLLGKRVVRAECRWPDVVRALAGTTCTSIEAIGKHLLVGFDDDTFLRVHLGMPGSWHVYAPGERWQRPRADLGVLLETDEDVLVCFRPPEVERLTQKERAHHRVLQSLGPDVLKDPFDLDEVVRRARHPDRADMMLAELLLDQRVSAGIGNIFKCEALHALRLSPHAEVHDVDDDTLRALYAEASRMMRASVASGRAPGRIYRARACGACGGRVQVEEQGERLTWWCPRCQPERRP